MSMKLISRKNEAVFNYDNIVRALFACVPPMEFGISSMELEMSEEERKTYHSYIRIMAELGWPAYNDSNFTFHERIVQLVETGQFDKIETAIYDHYDEKYIEGLQEYLDDVPLVNRDRLTILKEAFELYNIGYYYGCVALLASQIAGIAKDIEQALLTRGISFDSNNEELLQSRYRVSKTSEKAKIIRVILESSKNNDEEREYLFSIGYFRSIVFGDKLEGEDLLHHTSRHMVFHGEQLTFGSKEQALKLILCVEILYNVADTLYYELVEEMPRVLAKELAWCM